MIKLEELHRALGPMRRRVQGMVGRVRRIHATYGGGWRATLVCRADGSTSLSQAIKLVASKPEA